MSQWKREAGIIVHPEQFFQTRKIRLKPTPAFTNLVHKVNVAFAVDSFSLLCNVGVDFPIACEDNGKHCLPECQLGADDSRVLCLWRNPHHVVSFVWNHVEWYPGLILYCQNTKQLMFTVVVEKVENLLSAYNSLSFVYICQGMKNPDGAHFAKHELISEDAENRRLA